MARKGDILYNFLDSKTGENVNYQKVTTFADGSAMDDAKCDGAIYRKVGTEYFKRVTPGGYAPLEWFVGNDFTNGINNLAAVEKINKAGLKVKLPEGVIPLQAATDTSIINNPNTLWIEGAGKDKTKVILETKHSDATGSGTYAYFKGNQSVYFKDFDLTTRSIEDGILTEISDDYEFLSVGYPEQIKIEIYDCRISGSLIFRFNSDDTNKLTKFVELLRVKNCELDYISSLFAFSNCYCTTIDVQDNFISELLGTVVSSPYGAEGNKLVKWINNYLENTIIPTVTPWYHCPIVTRCHDFYYDNNTVKNLLNKDDTLRTSFNGAETYSHYASAQHLYFRNNIIENVSGLHGSIAFKLKGAQNVYAKGNKISLSREALVKIGVLVNETDDLSTIDKANYGVILFGATSTQRSKGAEFNFSNNEVKVSFVSRLSFLAWGHFNVSHNLFEVEYMVTHDNQQEIASFAPNSNNDEIDPEEKSIIDYNTVIVNKVQAPSIPVKFFSINAGNYFSITSTTVLRKLHSISYNKFGGGDVTYELGINVCKEIRYDKNETLSPDSKIIKGHYIFSSDSAAPTFHHSSSLFVNKTSDQALLTIPRLLGESSIHVKENTQDKIYMMKTGLTNWYISNLLFEYTIGFLNEDEVYEVVNFKHSQAGGYYNYKTQKLETFDARNDTPYEILEFFPKEGSLKKVRFFVELFSDRTAHWSLTGLAGSRVVDIKMKVSQRVVTADFHEPFLSPVKNRQVPQNLGLHKDPSFGLHQLGGGQKLEALVNPSAPTITNVGTEGTTNYTYYVVAEDRNGNKTLVSGSGSTTTGNATLDATNYNKISWAAVDGAVKYYVLKGDTATLLGTTGGTSLNDTGQATSAFISPTRNQTADALIDGRLNASQIAVGNSQAGTTPGTVVKKIEVFDSVGNSLGFVPVYDSIS
jgi:hypothetical protein